MTAFSEADRKRILESLTPDELATFKEAFTVFDKNNDGTITTKVHSTKFRYFFAKMSIHY
jgi:Ca2+-binding EF-hand superfamily protein